jgi:cytochrome c553
MSKFFEGLGKWVFVIVGAVPALSQAAWVHFDPADTAQVPKKFSETGFYSNWQTKTITPEAAAFDVNTPLWSDAASKTRWILLKNPTDRVQFNPAEDYYEYPDGAVFVKLFQHDTIPGNAASRIKWETRLLVNKKSLDSNSMQEYDYWYAFSYRWNPDGSEAELVPETGFNTSLNINSGGQQTVRKWAFPSVSACNECHRQYDIKGNAVQGRAVLGFYTPQINRGTVANPNLNQITELFQKNILTWSQPSPTAPVLAQLPKWGRVDDESVPLDTRARAYIAANCSGCHGERGLATNATPHVAQLNYDFFKKSGDTLVPSMELRGAYVGIFDLQSITTPTGKTIEPALVVPGYPEISVLLYRMKQRNHLSPEEDGAFAKTLEQMPPVGVFEEDTLATRMISRWITGLTPAAIHRGSARFSTLAPQLHGNILTIDVATSELVFITGLDGHRRFPTLVSAGRYQRPSGLAPGLYILQAGNKSYRLIF